MRPPGSKSISNRAIVLAALGEGRSRLIRPLRAEDTEHLVAALQALGTEMAWQGDDLVVEGIGASRGGRFPRGGTINLGDGGTPTRFMLALACLAGEPVTIDGSARMRERPIADGVELLRSLGATIEYLERPEALPIRVSPAALRGGRIEVGATSSSQFISALMLIAPVLPEGLEIHYRAAPTSASYLALTRAVLKEFGVEVADRTWVGPRCDRIERTTLAGRDYEVEADASSAVYWMVAGAIVPESAVAIDGLVVGSPQPDIEMLEVLEDAGVPWSSSGGAITVSGPQRLAAIDRDFSRMPDGAMAAAMLAACAAGRSTLRGLATLRVKESDRIAALATELRRVGCAVDFDDDTLTIDGPFPDAADWVACATYGDHRMAMSLATLGLRRGGIAIANPGCVSKSYPGFWSDLGGLVPAALRAV